MKTIAFLICFTMITLPAVSQEKAQSILDKVATKTSEMGAVKIIFNYSMTNEEAGIDESYQGEILTREDKYRLKISGQEIISNGEKTWTYIPDAQEVQVNDAAAGSNEFNPTSMLQNYKEKYDVAFLQKKTINNRDMAVLKLTPANPDEFEKAHLIVDLVKDEIFRLTIFDGTDNEYTYEVVELLPNIGLSGNEFTFNPEEHPDVDVIDMR